jgi:hypothetical protein
MERDLFEIVAEVAASLAAERPARPAFRRPARPAADRAPAVRLEIAAPAARPERDYSLPACRVKAVAAVVAVRKGGPAK